jgi:hypothetical protein
MPAATNTRYHVIYTKAGSNYASDHDKLSSALIRAACLLDEDGVTAIKVRRSWKGLASGNILLLQRRNNVWETP